MRITKRGVLPATKVYQFECNHCHTEFECEQGEASYISDQRDGDYLAMACPVCGRSCTVYA